LKKVNQYTPVREWKYSIFASG